MELDGLPDFALDVCERVTSGDAPWKVGDIGGEVALGLLDNDRVAHGSTS